MSALFGASLATIRQLRVTSTRHAESAFGSRRATSSAR